MSYASMQVGGYFPPIMRAEFAIEEVVGGVLTFLTHAMTTRRPNVFMEVERYDAVITTRDNGRNEIAKLQEAEQATA